MSTLLFSAKTYSVKSLWLLLLLVLCVDLPLVTTASVETIERRPGQTIEQIVQSVLPAGSELMHKVVQVDIGTHGKVIVAIYRASPSVTNYNGYVLIPEDGSHRLRVSTLPPLKEAEGLFDFNIISVFSAVLPSGQKGLAVLYSYLRLGSGEDPKNAGYFYLWNGRKWTIDEQRTKRLVGIDNAANARAKLSSP